jgi:hypothetical protein
MTNKPLVGYRIANNKEGITGEPGIIYDYLLTGEGLHVVCKSSLLEASINIAPARVKGLIKVKEGFKLAHGTIPYYLYSIAENIFLTDPWRESYFAIVWENGRYSIKRPEQDRRGGSVTYEVIPNIAVNLHSHGSLHAFFSDQHRFRVDALRGT